MNGAQTNRQTENRATGAAAVVVNNFAPVKGRPIKSPIGVLNQCVSACAIRFVEVMQRRQRACCRDFKHRPAGAAEVGAISSTARCPVEVAIAGLYKRCARIARGALQRHRLRMMLLPKHLFPPGIGMKLSATLFLLACGLMTQSGVAQSREDDPPEANPGRPTCCLPMRSACDSVWRPLRMV